MVLSRANNIDYRCIDMVDDMRFCFRSLFLFSSRVIQWINVTVVLLLLLLQGRRMCEIRKRYQGHCII